MLPKGKFIYMLQGRIQDFKLGGGAHLKKLRRAEGGAKIVGVFRVKNHDFTPKNHIFSNFRGGGGAPAAPPPPPWIRPCVKKEVLCCKFLIFNNCNFVCFRVFLLYTSIESTCICKIFILPHPVFGRSGCRLSNSTVIFLPDVSDVWRWPNPVKILNVPFLFRSGTKE